MPIDLNQKIQEFGDNADRVDQWVNDPVGYTDKNGNPVDSIPKLIEDLEVSAQATAVFQARDEVEADKVAVEGLVTLAQTAQAASELARDAAQLSKGIWPTTASGIGNGVAGAVITSGGSGGTNGTFPLAFSGGTQVLAPAGVFTVVGGAVVSVTLTYPGYYSAGTPTFSFAASVGLTGANITAVMAANTNVNEYFSVPVAGSNDSLILYRVDTGPVAFEVTRYSSAAAMAELQVAHRVDRAQWSNRFQNIESGSGLTGTFYTSANVVTDASLAQSLQLAGAGIVAPRFVQTPELGRIYQIRYKLRRSVVPADPVAHPILLKVRGLTNAYANAAGANYTLETIQAADTTIIDRTFTVSRDVPYADLILNSSSVHFRPAVQTNAGDDGTTVIALIEIRDITDEYLFAGGPIAAYISPPNVARALSRRGLPGEKFQQRPDYLTNLISRLSALEAEVGGIRLTRTAVYADPTAVGANDGSSWANAFTSLKAALEAASPGDVVYSNSTETDPFPAEAAASISNGVTWCSNAGPDGETWISGAQRGIWTDEGGGIFSLAQGSEPPRVAYDFKRDDVTGTVTGVDLTYGPFAKALARWNLDPADCVAWYGFMEKEAVPTTTPGEGKWSYTGGRIYINPPGSPVLVDVNTKAIFSNDTAGVFLSNKSGTYLEHFRHYGKLTVHFTPHVSGAGGYSVRSSVAQNCSIEDVRGIASGNHMVGLSSSSGKKNTIRNCIATGGSGSSNPYVFRGNIPLPNAGHVGDKLIYIVHPYLKTDGSPLDSGWQSFTGNIAYSHGAGGVVYMGGILWSRLLQINCMQQIATKQGGTLTAGVRGVFVNAGDIPPIDPDNASSFAVRCFDSLAIGPQSGPSFNVYYNNVEFDTLGGLQGQFSFNTVGGPYYVHLDGCKLKVNAAAALFAAISATNGRVTLFDNEITLDNSGGATSLLAFATTAPGTFVRIGGNTFIAENGQVHLVATQNADASGWRTNQVIDSRGGNVFRGLFKTVRTINGATLATDAQWVEGADQANEDVLTA